MSASAQGAASSSRGAFWRGTRAVFSKDVRIELRTRELLTVAGFFAILVTTLAAFSFQHVEGAGPASLWLPFAFASVLAISRIWQRERDDGTLLALMASPIPRAAIFAGKALAVLLFLLAVLAVLVPWVALLFHLDLSQAWAPLTLVCVLGALGTAAVGTLFGVGTARTSGRDLMLSVLMLTLLAPMLIGGIGGTMASLSGARDDVRDWLMLLTAFDALACGGGLLLFPFVVDD